jgi:hypothetical protein
MPDRENAGFFNSISPLLGKGAAGKIRLIIGQM